MIRNLAIADTPLTAAFTRSKTYLTRNSRELEKKVEILRPQIFKFLRERKNFVSKADKFKMFLQKN
eukprot:snap_masked-scaffold_33-processed-gene-0.44-mRNA-1 protein AED:1.00 eAED:1.00 QI:0/0/0/0/1/1/2/0/65